MKAGIITRVNGLYILLQRLAVLMIKDK